MSRRGTPSPRPAPGPAPPPFAPPCRSHWECPELWSHLSWVFPPPGPDQESSYPTTCGSTADRGCRPTSPRTARSSRRRPQPLRLCSSPSTTQPRSAAWGCRATCLATLAHSCDSSLSVDLTRSPEQPHPFAPQPTAIRRRITATTGRSASVPASVLCSSRIPPLGVLPLASGQPGGCIGSAFTRSAREPGPGSCCLYAGHHLGSKRISPRFLPRLACDLSFEALRNWVDLVSDCMHRVTAGGHVP